MFTLIHIDHYFYTVPKRINENKNRNLHWEINRLTEKNSSVGLSSSIQDWGVREMKREDLCEVEYFSSSTLYSTSSRKARDPVSFNDCVPG